MLNIDVVTVRTLRGVYTEDGRDDDAPGAAKEPVLAAPVSDGVGLAGS
jgi:hypothetical protein